MAIRGARVCAKHGGASPQARRAAKLAVEQALARVRLASPRAVERLVELVESEDEAIAMRSADLVLKRVLPDTVRMELEAAVRVKGNKSPGQIITERLAKLAARSTEIEDASFPEPEPPAPPAIAPAPATSAVVPGEDTELSRRLARYRPTGPVVVDADPDV